MFDDIRKISYNRLKLITEHGAYRGSEGSNGAYPLGDRKYSNRHFRPLEDGSYALYYAHRESMDNRVKENTDANLRAPFAIVRPDNTIEFTRGTGYQSENLILRGLLNANVTHSKPHEGTVIANHATMHPMFQGLKLDLDTMQTAKPYELYAKVLIREKANELIKQFDDFKVISMTMFNAMNGSGINEMVEEMRLMARANKPERGAFIEAYNKGHYVDALMLFFFNDLNFWYYIDANEERIKMLKTRVQNKLKLKFNEYVIRQNDSPYKLVQLETGKPFRSSKWGYKIVQDGENVIRL
jgi:hypothetical protein